MMKPISGAGICHSGTRIGSTKAIDSALNASKNVALPMTIRATTYQRDVGTCSIRTIRVAAASSEANDAEGTAGASDHGSALATDKGFLPFILFFGPTLSVNTRHMQANLYSLNFGHAGYAGSDALHQRQNFFRDDRGAFHRRQMANLAQHRQCCVRHGLLHLLRHRDRGGV